MPHPASKRKAGGTKPEKITDKNDQLQKKTTRKKRSSADTDATADLKQQSPSNIKELPVKSRNNKGRKSTVNSKEVKPREKSRSKLDVNSDGTDSNSHASDTDSSIEDTKGDGSDSDVILTTDSGSSETDADEQPPKKQAKKISNAELELVEMRNQYAKMIKEKEKELASMKKSLSKQSNKDQKDELPKKNRGTNKLKRKAEDVVDSDSCEEQQEEEALPRQRGRFLARPTRAVKGDKQVNKKCTGKKTKKPSGSPRKTRSGRRRAKESSDDEENIDTYFVSDEEDSTKDDDEKTKEDIEIKKTDGSDAKVAQSSENVDNNHETSEPVNEQKKRENNTETVAVNEDDQKESHKKIRQLMSNKKLQEETKLAAKAEKDRRDRVAKLRKKHQIETMVDPKTNFTIPTKLVLEFEEDGETPAIEVTKTMLKKLKPHQAEAVEFMWDCVVETTLDAEDNKEGSGCILAHCMGLGKTLSVITLVHTLMVNRPKLFQTCLVVCPLNTALNWVNEWSKWVPKREREEVYELATSSDMVERADALKEWREEGGIMIMGYQLFRILVNTKTRSKKRKEIFLSTLIDPGPDIVICDEGHMLKNDASAISKSMNRIRTQRRIVLTGTPLQNNLIEYHCMVNFVKRNLLGTRREFNNRFVNPIINGQHKDSTAYDVKIMKRRAHVLHEMLAGFVQRRDYSTLTKFLKPKNEYVIAVRLSPTQMTFYEKYLEKHRPDTDVIKNTGGSLFTDYQSLMRIWTHPWILKMEEVRREKQMLSAWMDDEIDFFTSSEDEAFVSDTSDEVSSQSTSDEDDDSSVKGPTNERDHSDHGKSSPLKKSIVVSDDDADDESTGLSSRSKRKGTWKSPFRIESDSESSGGELEKINDVRKSPKTRRKSSIDKLSPKMTRNNQSKVKSSRILTDSSDSEDDAVVTPRVTRGGSKRVDEIHKKDPPSNKSKDVTHNSDVNHKEGTGETSSEKSMSKTKTKRRKKKKVPTATLR